VSVRIHLRDLALRFVRAHHVVDAAVVIHDFRDEIMATQLIVGPKIDGQTRAHHVGRLSEPVGACGRRG
jgi:hypothetical protein